MPVKRADHFLLRRDNVLAWTIRIILPLLQLSLQYTSLPYILLHLDSTPLQVIGL